MKTIKPFTFADFVIIVAAVENSCKGIGCGFARRDCRSRILDQQLAAWTRDHRNGTSQRDLMVLTDEIEQVLPDYFRELYRHRRTPETLEEFRRTTFDQLPKRPELIEA